jgi:hypothetical protein
MNKRALIEKTLIKLGKNIEKYNPKKLNPSILKSILSRYQKLFMSLVESDVDDITRPTLDWMVDNYLTLKENEDMLVPFFEKIREWLFNEKTNAYSRQLEAVKDFFEHRFKKGHPGEPTQMTYIKFPDLSKKYDIAMKPLKSIRWPGFYEEDKA